MWAILLTYGASLAAILTGGHNAAFPGQQAVNIPVSLHSGSSEDVASLQFDLVFDGDSLSLPSVIIGPAAQAADKALEFNTINAQTVRVVIAGLNQLPIPDGVIADAYFDVGAGAGPDVYPLIFDNALLSDPYGGPAYPDLEPGSIEVLGGEGEGEGEGEPPACGSLAGPNPGKRSGAADVLVMACTLTAVLLAGARHGPRWQPVARGSRW